MRLPGKNILSFLIKLDKLVDKNKKKFLGNVLVMSVADGIAAEALCNNGDHVYMPCLPGGKEYASWFLKTVFVLELGFD